MLVGCKTRAAYSYFAPAWEGPAKSDSNIKEAWLRGGKRSLMTSLRTWMQPDLKHCATSGYF